jgi:hypothetical protein
MKFLLIRKFIWLILFTLLNLWFMVFNWKLFITMLNVNLGFGVVRLPPFVVLFLAGFVIIAIQSWTGYVNKLHRIIHDLEQRLAQKDLDSKAARKSGIGVQGTTTQPSTAKAEQKNLTVKEDGKDLGKYPGKDKNDSFL